MEMVVNYIVNFIYLSAWLEHNERAIIAHNVLSLLECPTEKYDYIDEERIRGMKLEWDTLTIDTPNYECKFSTESGKLKSVDFGGIQVLSLDHCFYRSPTDNDKGGLDTQGGNIMPQPILEALKLFSPSECSFNYTWEKIGLNDIQNKSGGYQKEKLVRIY